VDAAFSSRASSAARVRSGAKAAGNAAPDEMGTMVFIGGSRPANESGLLRNANISTVRKSFCQYSLSTMTETKTAIVQLRLQPSLKKAAEKAATDDSRSLTSLIEKLLTDHLRKKGYLSK
jgi:hypothetical protein